MLNYDVVEINRIEFARCKDDSKKHLIIQVDVEYL